MSKKNTDKHASVYVMSAGNGEGPCKIGFTTNIKNRRRTMQIYHHTEVRVHYRMRCSTKWRCKRLERLVHHELKEFRGLREWFNLTAKQCEAYIREIANAYKDYTLEEMDASIDRNIRKLNG